MKEVYTLADLESRDLLDAGAENKPARLAVIGHPIAHSASPRMHQAAMDDRGENMRYIRIDVEQGKVGEAFARMMKLGFIGCNVTVPHKLEAMEHCEVDHHATMLGAVNTIHFDGNRTIGYNTDGPGFESAIEQDFKLSLSSMKVAVVGAGGGAGQAIATQCVVSGARKLVMVNRTIEKIDRLRDHLEDKQLESLFSKIWKDREIIALSFDDPALREHCLSCDLIVNTSSVGLKPGDPSILPADCLKPEHLVYDTIYQPPVTPLLAAAIETGCRASNGLSMLVHQGALAFQHWFPGSVPLPVMRAALGKTA